MYLMHDDLIGDSLVPIYLLLKTEGRYCIFLRNNISVDVLGHPIVRAVAV